MHGDPRLKIYTATITPASIRNSAELADGMFPIFMNPERFDLMALASRGGLMRSPDRAQRASPTYDICPFVPVSVGDDLEAARLPIKQNLALYVGGMGAREKNFYNDYAKRLGYEDAAVRIQDAFLAGRKTEAVDSVPDALIDEIALVGPAARIRDRLEAWKAAAKERHVHSLLLSRNVSAEALRVIADGVL